MSMTATIITPFLLLFGANSHTPSASQPEINISAETTTFVHAVYFWLREDLTAEEIAGFEEGVRSLLTISSVKVGHIGKPASTDRPIIDRSYSYALIVMFEDEAGHDHYQVDPIHDAFRDNFAGYWTRVQIYDSAE